MIFYLMVCQFLPREYASMVFIHYKAFVFFDVFKFSNFLFSFPCFLFLTPTPIPYEKFLLHQSAGMYALQKNRAGPEPNW
jgi:hypothetical protein